MNQFYFHIGMPKAASSYLQKNFFPLLNLTYLGKHYTSPIDYSKKHFDFEKMFRELFVMQPYNLTNAFKKDLLDLIPINDNQTILYSNEGLFGSYFESFRNVFQIFHNIKKVFYAPKIIVIIRRQDTFLESLYRQAIRNGYWRSVNAFLGLTQQRSFESYKIHRQVQVDMRTLKYDDFLSFVCEILGKENILIVPYEQFLASRNLFLDQLASFLETPLISPLSDSFVNASDRMLYLNFVRVINFFSHKIHIAPPDWAKKILSQVGPRSNYISNRLREDLLDYFKKSNIRLSEDYKIENLHKFGYY